MPAKPKTATLIVGLTCRLASADDLASLLSRSREAVIRIGDADLPVTLVAMSPIRPIRPIRPKALRSA